MVLLNYIISDIFISCLTISLAIKQGSHMKRQTSNKKGYLKISIFVKISLNIDNINCIVLVRSRFTYLVHNMDAKPQKKPSIE